MEGETKMSKVKKQNMYSDSVKQWNVVIGCNFDCIYCKKSFQAQMKRQKPMIDKNGKKRGCQECYDYKPHFHPERLKDSLPNTTGDQFIWCCSSSDIFFADTVWMELILNKIREYPNRTFFFQTKDPSVFTKYDFPKNVMLGITLETNEYPHGYRPSKAPLPWHRYILFKDLKYPRKVITIEPIMEFRYEILLNWIIALKPERVYIGYDTKKNNLPEPSIEKTRKLIDELEHFTKVKQKYMKS